MNAVWVAVYKHEYGSDIRVFTSRELCDEWADAIARDWWDNEFPDEPMPEKDPGIAYFRLMLEREDYEYLDVQQCAVEHKC